MKVCETFAEPKRYRLGTRFTRDASETDNLVAVSDAILLKWDNKFALVNLDSGTFFLEPKSLGYGVGDVLTYEQLSQLTMFPHLLRLKSDNSLIMPTSNHKRIGIGVQLQGDSRRLLITKSGVNCVNVVNIKTGELVIQGEVADVRNLTCEECRKLNIANCEVLET